MAKVVPHETTQYKFAQSKFAEKVPELPLRAILCAPSSGGKTTLLVSMCLDLYPRKFERIYVFSPSANLDSAWGPVKDYVRDVLHVQEPCFFSEFDEGRLQAILHRQMAITKLAKERKMTKLFNILVIIDDFADNPRVCRASMSLHQCFTRMRHCGISTVLSVQRYKVLHPILRVNATDLIVFRLRSAAEQRCIADENSAQYGLKATEALLRHATAEPYSFCWLNLRSKTPDDLFWLRFDRPMRPGAELASPSGEVQEEEEEEEEDLSPQPRSRQRGAGARAARG